MSTSQKSSANTALSADQALAQAEAIFLSIGEGAIVINQFGKISRINKIALDMLGYTKDEVLGKPFLDMLKCIDKSGHPVTPIDRPITQVFVLGKPVSVNTYYLRKDLSKFPAAITVSPIILDGKPTGAIQVFRDITLEREIDRMKSEFISIASHQLRTPLTAIKTYAHMLYKGFAGDLNDPQKEFVNIIIASSDHMNKLIDTLLDISLIEAGKLAVVRKKVDIDQFLKEIVGEFTLQAVEKNITVRVKTEDLPTFAYIDPLLMREVYSNLLSNAIKYTPAKGKIVISLSQKNNNLTFSVKDNGHGIPESHKDRIFGKFFRAPNIMSLEANGSGLGLYMVKGIADNLNGKVWFDSREGKGSTFYFSMPSLIKKNVS